MNHARSMIRLLVAATILACGILYGAEAPVVGPPVAAGLSVQAQEDQAQARNFFETGMMLYRQRQFAEAEPYFRRALKKDPGHALAQEHLIRIRSILGRRSEVVSEQADWVARRKEVYGEELKVQLDHRIAAARKDHEHLLAQPDLPPGETLKQLEALKVRFSQCLELSGGLPGKLDAETYGATIRGCIDEVQKGIARTNERLAIEQREKAQVAHQQEVVDNERYVENKIRKMLAVIADEIAARRYASAEKIADDVLTIDPLNKQAAWQRQRAEQLRQKVEEVETADVKAQEANRKVLRIKESAIPYVQYIVYPKDWQSISQRQQQAIARKQDPEWKLQIQRQMEQILNYRCPGLPIDQVLTQLSDITGTNILLDPAVTRGVEAEKLFIPAFQFQGMKFKHIITWVARKADLKWVLKDDAVLVTGLEAQGDNLSTNIYDIQDLLSERKNFTAPDLSVGEVGGGEAAINIADEPEAAGDGKSGEQIIEMIKRTVPGKWDVQGNGVQLTLMAQAGSILIKNTPEIHNQVVELLSTLRKTSSMLVEVEARKMLYQKGFFRDIGFDWKGLNTGESMISAGSTQAPGFQRQTDLTSVKGVVDNSLPTMGTSQQLGLFIEHSVLSNLQAKVLFRMLEENRSSTELISPRVILMNNVNGYIRLGRKQYYISGYGSGGSGLQPTIADIDEGQLLKVRATISSDRRYITMQVQPDFQGVGMRDPVYVTGYSFSTQRLPVDLPIIQRQKVRTTAVIPDGGVLILGGVAESKEDQSMRGVPVLSRIPLLGRLFRSDGKSDSTLDQMYLVTGSIILTDDIEAEL